jgi:hypothetical protein
MPVIDDLYVEVRTLAAAIRERRAERRPYGSRDVVDIAALETRMKSLWDAIRAARRGDVETLPLPVRRTRPKWQ